MKYNYQNIFYTSTSLTETFNYATDVKKRGDWILSIKSAQLLTEEPVKLGSRFEEDGQTGKMVLEFVELVNNKRIRYKTIEGKGVFADISWDLDSKDNQTKIHLSLTLTPKGFIKILFPILFPLIIKPNMKKEFKLLKDELDKIHF
ncbi:hypothetical protein DNU06_15760 [Putridiphycobacter roseus]|uniref:Activator of Hsp90 ATPase homologue 1/2-like C-terminal domain-containing protein n=1 Tax=Putridiphycobacter roseus TaxID=2219161 RepID=A0A2W1N9A3_9FLAO|nr:SRPBCC domain-containing protein [Putridiphycobacter roseus]PZE15835.1 hypothetical protein DNU06_15760 [Putridiphycobacter roseus]